MHETICLNDKLEPEENITHVNQYNNETRSDQCFFSLCETMQNGVAKKKL